MAPQHRAAAPGVVGSAAVLLLSELTTPALSRHQLLCEEGNHQNNSFNANWIWRDVVAVLVITPAEEL